MFSSAFHRQLPVFRHALPRHQNRAFLSEHSIFHRRARIHSGYLSGRQLGVTGTGGICLGLATYTFAVPIYCQATAEFTSANPPADSRRVSKEPLPPPPQSSVNLYELSFGTLAGVCTGVFVKKGARAVAFVFGGTFVLLQYFRSIYLIQIDWAVAGSKFENLFYTTDADGVRHSPTIASLWRWLVNFLAADFQQRASFIAGLVLGIRIG